jgi:sugar O-acyltransferase, sialic acid O-acetyltransferase NeuD family
MDTDVILVGGFHEIIELCEDAGVNVIGIIDGRLHGSYYGIPVLGSDEDASSVKERYGDVPVVVTPDAPSVRKKLVEFYRDRGFRFMTLVSPFSKVSKYATLGEGCVVQSMVNISAGTHVGSFVKLNIGCNIMHDNAVGDYSTVAPGAVSLGRVSIGEGVYVGANSTILPEMSVGYDSVVGAGSVVTHDVAPCSVVKGVPAK